MFKSYFLLVVLCCLLGLFVAQPVFALDVGLTYGGATGLGSKDLRVTVAEIVRVSLGVLAIIALVLVFVSGVYYLKSKDDVEKKQKALKILTSATIGLVIALTAYALSSFILSKLLEATGVEIVGGGEIASNENNNVEPTVYNGENCIGDYLDYAYLCDFDDYDVPPNTPNTLVADCTNQRKCEYICDYWSGYLLINGSCQINPYQCTGSFANATVCEQSDLDLRADTPITLVTSCTRQKKCEFSCNSRYLLINGSCQPNPYVCQGNFNNATICHDDQYDLSANTNAILVAGCTYANKCEYKCNSGFVYDNGSCKDVCQGNFSNASLCKDDELNLPANTQPILVSACTSANKCEYTCNTGFVLSGNNCQATDYAQVGADNGFALYLNGQFIGSVMDWRIAKIYPVSYVTGQNIIAINAIDVGMVYGLVAQFGNGTQIFADTDSPGWKCLNVGRDNDNQIPFGVLPAGWKDLNFDDSAWLAPKIVLTDQAWKLNVLGMPNASWIWAANTGSLTSIICRYKLNI